MNFSDVHTDLPAHKPESRSNTWPLEEGMCEAARPVTSSSTKLIDSAPEFSLETFLSAVDNDLEFAVELLELMLSQITSGNQAIGQALDENDLDGIGRIIHSQKAPFTVFGLTAIVHLGQDIDMLIRANMSMTEIAPLITHYVRSLDAERPLLENALQTLL